MLKSFHLRISRQPASPASPASTTPSPEEPTVQSGDGFGFLHPGLFLKNGRYEILRKLGQGQSSSTWLVSDNHAKEMPTYHAIKVLKGRNPGLPMELDVLKAIKGKDSGGSLPHLFDHFEASGPQGRHLCLVQQVLSTDVSSFRRSAPSKRLDFQTVKVIVAQVLEALIILHAERIIHTDLKSDNVLFCDGTGRESVQELLNSSPLAVHNELELYGERSPVIRSQPLPHPFRWNDPPALVELYSVQLIGLGHAQWIDKPSTTQAIRDYGLCAPEVILGAKVDAKSDIWALGCMTFELLTGNCLFSPKAGQKRRIEDDHLAKMMELMGETFSETFLSTSGKRDEYFYKNGKLRHVDQLSPLPLQQAMMNCNLRGGREVADAAEFIRACLHLNPNERSSAADLEDHPWLEFPM